MPAYVRQRDRPGLSVSVIYKIGSQLVEKSLQIVRDQTERKELIEHLETDFSNVFSAY